MALPFGEISAITHPMINESSADNIYASNPTFMQIKERGSVIMSGGSQIQLPIDYAKISAAGSYADYDVLDTTPNATQNAAKYDWRQYYANVVVSMADLLKNSGESQAVNLLKGKVENAQRKLRDVLGTDLFSANADSATGIVGLRQLVKASGQVGNVNSSDFAGWASDIDAATSALTLSAMEQQFLDAEVAGDFPDMIVTTKGVWGKLWNLLQANQRFAAAQVGKGGFRYLMFNDVPVFHDSHCPGSSTSSSTADKHMFFLNSKWLYLFVHKDDNFVVEEMPRIAQQRVHIDQISVTLAFGTDNRRMHSAFTVLKH